MLEGFEDNTEMKLKDFSLESYTVKTFNVINENVIIPLIKADGPKPNLSL